MSKRNLTNLTPEQFKEYMLDNLPPIISRDKIEEFSGGFFALATMQKYDSQGKGPNSFQFKDRKIGYLREDFINWMISHINFEELKGIRANDNTRNNN